MAITFDCPECMKPLQLSDSMAGQKGTCPACGTSFRVPKTLSAPRPPAPAAPPPTPPPSTLRPRPPVGRPAASAPVASPAQSPPTPAVPRSRPAAPVARPAPAVARPAADVLPAEPAPSQGIGPGCLLHLLPVAFLAVGLLVVIARDFFAKWEAPVGQTTEAPPVLIDPDPLIALGLHDHPEDVLLGEGGVKPEGGAQPTNTSQAVWEPSMRFGLVMVKERDPKNPLQRKRLTFDEKGMTNNTCVRLDGNEWLFGERPFRLKSTGMEVGGSWPGRWDRQDITNLGLDPSGRKRLGHQSVWVYDEQHVFVTQTVELVPGAQSRYLDTCLVRYRLDNKDSRPHKVGIRFLLDTYIGANDGVPFTIPGQKQLCDTMLEFSRPEDVPDFIQALEHEDLAHPGTIAHLQLRLGGKLDPPDRVTLGSWPNPRLAAEDPRCRQEKTLWDVPVLSIKALTPADSAVTIYWNDKDLDPGASREVGFAYGLGLVASGEGGGKLGLTVGGAFTPGGEFTLTAYVTNPQRGQTLTLTLPEGFRLTAGEATQPVPPLPPGSASANSPVTWKIKAPGREGDYTLKVQSSTGAAQTQPVRIRGSHLFD